MYTSIDVASYRLLIASCCGILSIMLLYMQSNKNTIYTRHPLAVLSPLRALLILPYVCISLIAGLREARAAKSPLKEVQYYAGDIVVSSSSDLIKLMSSMSSTH